MSPRGHRPIYPAATLGGPATPPPAPVDRGGLATPAPWGDTISMPVDERDAFDAAINAPTVQWVELPDALIQRLYALDLGPEADDLADRIEVLVVLQEVPDPQCEWSTERDADGIAWQCQHKAGHDGEHQTADQMQEPGA